jgi:hypothetical protein
VKLTNRVFLVELVVQINYDADGQYFPTQQDAEVITTHILRGDTDQYNRLLNEEGRSYDVRLKSNR